MDKTLFFLDYVATHPDAVLTYNKRNMVLAVHSDASYLTEPKSRSRAGGPFFLSKGIREPENNGAVLNIVHIRRRGRNWSTLHKHKKCHHRKIST